MKRRSRWTLWTDAAHERSARKVLVRVLARLDAAVEDTSVRTHAEGGHRLSFAIPHAPSSWTEQVVEVLRLAQRLGGGWTVTGLIDEELDAHLLPPPGGHCSVAGICSATVSLTRAM